jgi:hypothetical protein
MTSLSGKVVPLALLLVGIAASAILLLNAYWGVGVDHDSILYLSAAQNLAGGRGLVWTGSGSGLVPLTQYPPGYPILIASLLGLGAEVMRASTWASALLLGLNVTLAGFLILHFTQDGWSAVAASAVLAISPFLFSVHDRAMSEPLFIFFWLITLGTLMEHLERPSWGLLAGSAFGASLAIMTRYVGISMVPAASILLMIYRAVPMRRRFLEVALFGLLSLGPFLLWLGRNSAVSGHSANRILSFHPIDLVNLRLGFQTLLAWIYPGLSELTFPEFRNASLLVSALIGVFTVFVAWQTLSPARRATLSSGRACALRFSMACLCFAGIYGAAVMCSLYFFDASTRLDNRMLSPAYVALILAFLSFASGLRRPARIASFAAVVALICLYAPTFEREVTALREQGHGFTSRSWRESDLIKYLQGTSQDSILYSNQALPLQFLSGRPILTTPQAFDSVKDQARPEYSGQLAQVQEQLREPRSVLVLVDADNEITSQEIAALTQGLELIRSFREAAVYASPENVSSGLLP